MVERLVKDESGMAMALAIITMVLVGVMGAGLLVFVQRDLETVVEVNQGQKALAAADAGIEAGKMQLGIDSNNELYNAAGGDLDGDGVDASDSSWSCNWSGIACAGTGQILDFNGNQVTVKIQYLKPTPAASPSLVSNPSYAPEVLPSGETKYPNKRDYFKINAEGAIGDAKRSVEAIYRTMDTGYPYAYFATGNTDFNGNAFSIDNVSLFSEASITDLRGDKIGGCDLAYGDWYNAQWNTTRRAAVSGTQTLNDNSTCVGYPAGVASEGTISYQSGSAGRKNVRDYDRTTNPDFIDNTWTASGGTQVSNDITYPFNTDPSTQVDLDILRAAAESGQNGSKFVRRPPGDTNFHINDYPANSNQNTVYFVEFANADGTFVNGSGTAVAKGGADYTSNVADPKGTIVVVNGDFKGSPSSKTYTGVILIRDPVDSDGIKLEYLNSGNFKLQGFANAEGDLKISGNADSATPATLISWRRTGSYTMERWSWRECYSVNCS